MADAGLFVGWGAPVTGREAKGLEVFAEAGAFYGASQEAGDIESVEVFFLASHGGGLSGFFLRTDRPPRSRRTPKRPVPW